MTNNVTSSVGPALCWQLRAEFWTTPWPGGDRQQADQVTETLQELDLRPQQLQLIHEAMLEAIQRASLRAQPPSPVSTTRIRIWVAGECSQSRSWGFFLVEKPDSDLQGMRAQAENLLELFLYQEQDS